MKNILLAYDGGEPAKRALETAMDRRSGSRRTSRSSASCRSTPASPIDPWDDRDVHAQELLEARRVLAENGIEAEMIEPAGDPAKEIEKIATAGKFDTIVIGTRGLGTLSRVLQGSVSEHVAKNADAIGDRRTRPDVVRSSEPAGRLGCGLQLVAARSLRSGCEEFRWTPRPRRELASDVDQGPELRVEIAANRHRMADGTEKAKDRGIAPPDGRPHPPEAMGRRPVDAGHDERATDAVVLPRVRHGNGHLHVPLRCRLETEMPDDDLAAIRPGLTATRPSRWT